MSFFSKVINMLKVEEEKPKAHMHDDCFIAKGKVDKEVFKETFVEKRKHKRVAILASFCVFVCNESEETDYEKAPFINAWVYDISLGGAALKCESFVACSPYSTEEKIITQNMFVELVANVTAQNNSCSCSIGCDKENDSKCFAPQLGDAPIKAQVMWVSGNHFGCMFVNPTEAFAKVVNNIVNEVSNECESK